jgi:hypothetical protein
MRCLKRNGFSDDYKLEEFERDHAQDSDDYESLQNYEMDQNDSDEYKPEEYERDHGQNSDDYESLQNYEMDQNDIQSDTINHSNYEEDYILCRDEYDCEDEKLFATTSAPRTPDWDRLQMWEDYLHYKRIRKSCD